MKNQKGSALIETVLVAPLIAMVLLAGGTMLYLSFAKVWMNRAAREAAICLATPSPPSRCRARLVSTLQKGIPIGQIEIRNFQTDSSHTKVAVVLNFEKMQRSKSPNLIAAAIYRKPKYYPSND